MRILLVACVLLSLPPAPSLAEEAVAPREQGRLQRESYAAHVAAAAQALELDRTAEAKRWLAGAPEALRGWEWGHLARLAESQESILAEGSEAWTTIAASPDGTLVAAASEKGTLALWRTASRESVWRLAGEGKPIRGLAFSPDGALLASAGRDLAVRLRRAGTGELVTETSIDADTLSRIAWSPTGDALVVGGFRRDPETRRPRGFFVLLDPATLALRERRDYGFAVGPLAFSPDGAHLAVAEIQGRFAVWSWPLGGEPENLRIEESHGFPQVAALAFSPDGSRLATGSDDGALRLWDTASWRLAATLSPRVSVHRSSIRDLAYSPDGRWLLSAAVDQTLRLWRPDAAPEPVATLHGHVGSIEGLAFLAGRDEVASASLDGSVRLWRPEAALTATLDQGESVWDLDLSPDGRRLATAAADGNVRVWELASRRQLWSRSLHEGDAALVRWVDGGRMLLTGGNDGHLRLVDSTTGEPVATLERLERGRALGADSSSDGRLVAVSAPGTAKVWDLATRTVRRVLAGHDEPITRAFFTPEGRRVVTVAGDGRIVVHDAETGAILRTIAAHELAIHGAALSPDGRKIATASEDRSVRVFDLATGERRLELRGHDARVWDVSWSPDGERLATASNDFTLRLWDAGTGEPLWIRTFPIEVYRSLWSADGRTLFAVPFDGRVTPLEGGPEATVLR